MDKGNIKRLIIWATLLVMFVTLSILGIVKYYQGYGKYGSIRKELLPIVDIFNSLDKIKDYDASIKAKISNDQIIVNYTDDNTDIDYNFKYYTDNKTLNLKYNVFYTKSASFITEAMIDAISVHNGNNEGDVFKKYKLTDFYSSNINYGIKISNDGKYIIADMSIDKNIIEKLEDVVLTPIEVTYITVNDISNIFKELESNNTFEYSKNNISLFVTSDDNSYNIYVSNKNNDNNVQYESIMSIISMLNTNIYDELISYKIKFDTSLEKLKYSVIVNPTIDDKLIKIDKTNLVKIVIKK